MNPFVNFAWWQKLQRAYARRYVCPHWGHKPAGEYGWSIRYIGKFDKQASAQGTCENCGDVITNANQT